MRNVSLAALLLLSAGCDLGGPKRPSEGTELIYALDLSRFSAEQGGPTPADQVKTVVANRLDIYGLKEFAVDVKDGDRISVLLPVKVASAELEAIRPIIEKPGILQFVLVAPDSEQTKARVQEVLEAEKKVAPEKRQDLEYVARAHTSSQSGNTFTVLHNDAQFIVTGRYLNRADVITDVRG